MLYTKKRDYWTVQPKNQFSMSVMKAICGDLKETDEHLVTMTQKTV
jgi:hypothetical protein